MDQLDADGLVALPGLVDLHTHLREPGREDAETVESGTLAAARGGFTAVLAMANTDPGHRHRRGGRACCSAGRSGRSCAGRAGGRGEQGPGRSRTGRAWADGPVPGRVRVFSDDGHCVSDARLMRRALEYVRAFDGVIAQHAQDPQLAGAAACCHEGEISGKLGLPGWPAAAEAGVVARDVQIAELTRSRLHVCHVSCAETVDVIRWAKQRGINVTAEVAPHHLMLTTSEVLSYDPTYKVNPPLRPNEHVEAVREALADGTIDAVATDHAPHARHDKEHAFAEAAFGMLGLETALAVVMETMINSGLLSWPELAKRMSIMPAHIARLADQGHPLAKGEPANVVLVDPAARAVVNRDDSASLSRNNPWHGRELPDPVVATIWAGRVTYQKGQ